MTTPTPPVWSDDAAEFVDAFRADVAADADVAAAWGQFEKVMEPAKPRRRRPFMWAGAVAALAAAAALVWVVGSATSMQSLEPEFGQQAPDRAATGSGGVAPLRSPAAGPRLGLQEARETAAPAPVPASVSVSVEASPRPASKVRRAGTTAPAVAGARRLEPGPAVSRLAEELRLLDAMRAASRTGRHADALRMVREHEAAFEAGPFAAERELAKVRALCGLGRLEQVRAAQAGFAKAHRASHLTSLMRTACPDAAKKIRKTDHDR